MLNELADKIHGKLDAMIAYYYPKPFCAAKKKQWDKDVKEIKRLLADRLHSTGIKIKIDIG